MSGPEPADANSLDILEQAAAISGIELRDPQLIRAGSNTIYRVGDIIGRIGKGGTTDAAVRELRISQWLNDSGLPTVRVADVANPLAVVDDRPITWWQRIPAHRAATPAELASRLRQLHALAPPTTFVLPDHEPFAGLRRAITSTGRLDVEDRVWLLGHHDRLCNQYFELGRPRRETVIHGDAWQGNVVVPFGGGPIIVDLDRVSLGRPEWDLIQVAADRTDFDRLSESDYLAFVDAYGDDVTMDFAFRLLADIQELRWTVFALSQSTVSASAAGEVRHRLACLRGEIVRPWRWNAL
ncbi:phosphotransferase family protein [Nocardia sp. NPDC058658]|uniref:phosphotransferase family protein n=1 Tax=Nocardia sp. NPDC058658 TaxID=3346580 RepID=UPI00364A04E1